MKASSLRRDAPRRRWRALGTPWATRWCAALALALVAAGCSPRDDGAMSGWAEADLVYVSAPLAGALKALPVVRGARVESGALLFELDTDAESLSRAQAQARLAQAQSQAANLKKGRRVEELRAVESQLAQAQAGSKASQAQLDRGEDLLQQGFISPSRLDDLRAVRDQDAARVRELQAQLAVARDAARPDEIAAAEAGAEAARAALALDRWREDQKRQSAPVGGLVYDVTYRVGERVAAYAPVLALLPDGAVKLRFYAPEPLLASIRVGAPVEVRCDGCPADLRATVTFVSPQAEFTPPVIYSNQTRAKLVFLVEARPDAAAAAQLKPGQPIEVRLAGGGGRG